MLRSAGSLVVFLSRITVPLLQNEFVLQHLYVMANLCQVGLDDETVNRAIDEVCVDRNHFDY